MDPARRGRGGSGDPLRLDHVTLAVADGEATAERLLRDAGLASFRGGRLPHLGARSWSSPLEPPSYVEWLQVDDPSVAAENASGRRILERLAAGDGLVAWTVRVDDVEALDAEARRLGGAVFEGATVVASGAVRRWWTVTGDLSLPVLIAYDDPDGSRLGRWREAYAGVGHARAPGGIVRIEVGNDRAELDAWLGPHDLPVAYVDGPPGILAAHVATSGGPLVLQ